MTQEMLPKTATLLRGYHLSAGRMKAHATLYTFANNDAIEMKAKLHSEIKHYSTA
jgi:hypothetical protein